MGLEGLPGAGPGASRADFWNSRILKKGGVIAAPIAPSPERPERLLARPSVCLPAASGPVLVGTHGNPPNPARIRWNSPCCSAAPHPSVHSPACLPARPITCSPARPSHHPRSRPSARPRARAPLLVIQSSSRDAYLQDSYFCR